MYFYIDRNHNGRLSNIFVSSVEYLMLKQYQLKITLFEGSLNYFVLGGNIKDRNLEQLNSIFSST